jgi:hypothetical protein
MSGPEFEFDDTGGRARDVAGSPEGDGDFETDNLPATGETSSGGQVDTGEAERDAKGKPAHKPSGLEYVIDEISSGKLMP